MLEIDVTEFAATRNMRYYQDSVARSGLEDIGRVTWENSLDAALDYPWINEENKELFCASLDDEGAWSSDELRAMSDQELSALAIQFVAGWILDREHEGEGYLYEADNGRLFAQFS